MRYQNIKIISGSVQLCIKKTPYMCFVYFVWPFYVLCFMCFLEEKKHISDRSKRSHSYGGYKRGQEKKTIICTNICKRLCISPTEKTNYKTYKKAPYY